MFLICGNSFFILMSLFLRLVCSMFLTPTPPARLCNLAAAAVAAWLDVPLRFLLGVALVLAMVFHCVNESNNCF